MIIVAARPAIGKALALDTPLPTPDGWTTMGEVAVGDRLLGADGRPTRVVAATEVMVGRPCYEVEFSDGDGDRRRRRAPVADDPRRAARRGRGRGRPACDGPAGRRRCSPPGVAAPRPLRRPPATTGDRGRRDRHRASALRAPRSRLATHAGALPRRPVSPVEAVLAAATLRRAAAGRRSPEGVPAGVARRSAARCSPDCSMPTARCTPTGAQRLALTDAAAGCATSASWCVSLGYRCSVSTKPVRVRRESRRALVVHADDAVFRLTRKRLVHKCSRPDARIRRSRRRRAAGAERAGAVRAGRQRRPPLPGQPVDDPDAQLDAGAGLLAGVLDQARADLGDLLAGDEQVRDHHAAAVGGGEGAAAPHAVRAHERRRLGPARPADGRGLRRAALHRRLAEPDDDGDPGQGAAAEAAARPAAGRRRLPAADDQRQAGRVPPGGGLRVLPVAEAAGQGARGPGHRDQPAQPWPRAAHRQEADAVRPARSRDRWSRTRTW